MITKAFAVYDSKALHYGVPFFMPSVGAAVRAFADLANESGSMLNKHPSDFVLYEIGSFDDHNSELIWKSPGVQLGLAADFIEKRPVQYQPAAGETNLDKFIRKSIDHPLATAAELSNEK